LAANGISVNAQPPQTTLAGVKQATIDELIRMKKECDAWMKRYYSNENNGVCNVVVSGGTEHGGYNPNTCSHRNGNKLDFRDRSGHIADTRPNKADKLTQFIIETYCCKTDKNRQAGFKDGCGPCGIRGQDGAKLYKSPTGAIYALESNHWDMVTRFACP
jgi:hypothetical protein